MWNKLFPFDFMGFSWIISIGTKIKILLSWDYVISAPKNLYFKVNQSRVTQLQQKI